MKFTPDQLGPTLEDRRLSPRYSMNGIVYLLGPDGSSSELGNVRDISLSGCFIAAASIPTITEKVRLRFAIGADFEMYGKVARAEPHGFAVEFLQQQTADAS